MYIPVGFSLDFDLQICLQYLFQEIWVCCYFWRTSQPFCVQDVDSHKFCWACASSIWSTLETTWQFGYNILLPRRVAFDCRGRQELEVGFVRRAGTSYSASTAILVFEDKSIYQISAKAHHFVLSWQSTTTPLNLLHSSLR